MTHTLILDGGNTSLKVGVVTNGCVVAQARRDEEFVLFWDRFLAECPVNEVLALIGNRSRYAQDLGLLRQRVPVQVLGDDRPFPDCGQYPTCGGDRICSGIGATIGGESQIVIDAGTATTITAWRSEGGPWPLFAGGVILPGVGACLAGLHHLAPSLPLVEPSLNSATSPLQHSTEGAIGSAMAIGYPAMVATLVDRIRDESGIHSLVQTGGNMAHLELDAPKDPDLVLKGLSKLV